MLGDVACRTVCVDVVIADEIEGLKKVGDVEFRIDSVGRFTHTRGQDSDQYVPTHQVCAYEEMSAGSQTRNETTHFQAIAVGG